MANPTDHLATVRAAIDLAGKATPGPWSVDRWEIAGADGRECARVVLTYDAPAIAALRNAAPAIAALADECERLRANALCHSAARADLYTAYLAAKGDPTLREALRAFFKATEE